MKKAVQHSHAKFVSHLPLSIIATTTSSYDGHSLAFSRHDGYFKTYCVL